jgi:hypothetical protein
MGLGDRSAYLKEVKAIMNPRDPIGAASATYRKVVNKIAKTLRVPPKHTRHPREDFDAVTDLIDNRAKKRALQWYERGIRRGFIEACDAFVDGQLKLKAGTLYSPSKLVISVEFKFHGESWQEREFRFKAEDLGFK